MRFFAVADGRPVGNRIFFRLQNSFEDQLDEAETVWGQMVSATEASPRKLTVTSVSNSYTMRAWALPADQLAFSIWQDDTTMLYEETMPWRDFLDLSVETTLIRADIE